MSDPRLHEQLKMLELTQDLQPFVLEGAEEGVAPTAVGLASDSGRFITGQTIFADGGIHVWGLNQHAAMPGLIYQVSSERA